MIGAPLPIGVVECSFPLLPQMTSSNLVLLVHDIADQADSYATAFAKAGYGVRLVTSGLDALADARTLQPDCVVIDLRLADMTGWELCRRLRDAGGAARLRIIVLTPDVSRDSAEDGVKVGCHAWLAHPAVAEDVVRTVRHVLSLDSDEPSSGEDAILVILCPVCDSDRVRATLRVSPIQYYYCRECRFSWRVDAVASEAG